MRMQSRQPKHHFVTLSSQQPHVLVSVMSLLIRPSPSILLQTQSRGKKTGQGGWRGKKGAGESNEIAGGRLGGVSMAGQTKENSRTRLIRSFEADPGLSNIPSDANWGTTAD